MRTKRASGRRRLTRSTFVALVATAGCAKLLGFDDEPEQTECVTDSDCSQNHTCVDWTCRPPCSGDECGGGGAGDGGGGANVGGTAGTSSTGGESGADATGGASAGRIGTGGDGVGALGGDSGIGGSGGTAGDPGGTGGDGGAGADGGSGGSGGIPPGGVCVPGKGLCLACDEDGQWQPGMYCTAACNESAGGCVVPPSCNALTSKCGPNLDCCHSVPVPGGRFRRTCDDICRDYCSPPEEGFPARLSPFSMDMFEVTVGRMRRFVSDFPSSKPASEAGKNPGNADDTGWNSAWDVHLPTTQEELRTALGEATCASTTWTDEPGDNESKPMNCANWYLAQAFCIWDGGRLPTHTEWTFVAGGGAQHRIYPWSTLQQPNTISTDYAVYAASAPAFAGSLTLGQGRWDHFDLSGNLAEWVFDVYDFCYPTPSECIDCGRGSNESANRMALGGSYNDDEAMDLLVEERMSDVDTGQYPGFGFRCARDLVGL